MKFDEKYKVHTWKHFASLHWILNPGLMIPELLLGIRVPKVSLHDKTVEKSIVPLTFVPCPHCNKIHSGLTWSKQNGTAFRNWFGLYCPNCNNIIPCLINGTSYLLLAITYPIWGWFRKGLKTKWFEKQPQRFQNLNLEPSESHPFEGTKWIGQGLIWGLLMFVVMGLLFPYFEGEEMTSKNIMGSIVQWAITGLLYGRIMKWHFSRVKRKNSQKNNQESI